MVSERLVQEAEQARNCAGLSAPQIGLKVRAFVLMRRTMEPLVCLNPQGVHQSDEWVDGQESCLSLPGVVAAVRRPKIVGITWMEVRGGRFTASTGIFENFEARVVAHEMDHLEGRTLLDYMNKGQRRGAEGVMQAARLRASRRPVLKNPARNYFNGD